jgi:hypothetical protein
VLPRFGYTGPTRRSLLIQPPRKIKGTRPYVTWETSSFYLVTSP